MKKEQIVAILIGAVLVFFVGIVRAETCSHDSQTILTLYSNSNSHGAIYNSSFKDVNAGVPICYDKIFGSIYYGENTWTCSGGNGVVNLVSSKNGHAAEKGYLGYGVKVCYGDLVCSLKGTCGEGEKEVAVMSSTSNAHLAVNKTYAPTYINRVCCSSPSAASEKLYWKSLSGSKITKSYVNRSVKLAAEGRAPNSPITFKIYEDDCATPKDCEDRTEIDTLSATSSDGGIAEVIWKINDSTMEKSSQSGDKDNGDRDLIELYFEVDNEESGILEVNKTITINTPPISRICSPEHRQIYFINSQINFVDCSTDDDGITSREWRVVETGEIISNLYMFNQMFTNSGQKTIVLRVSDGVYTSESQVAILIAGEGGLPIRFDGSSELEIEYLSNYGTGSEEILGFINSPRHNQFIEVQSLPIRVSFNASDTYIVNGSVSECTDTIKCLAGKCPLKSMNPKSGRTENTTVENPNQNWNNVNFNWTFIDLNQHSPEQTWSSEGNGKVEIKKPYGSPSKSKNDKKVELDIKFDYNGILLAKSISREFTLVQRCLPSDGKYIFFDDAGDIEEIRELDEGGCAGIDGLAGFDSDGKDTGYGEDDCCPGTKICKEGAGEYGLAACAIDVNAPSSCGDYDNENSCSKDVYKVATRERTATSPGNPERYQSPVCGSTQNGFLTICNNCMWKADKCVLNKTFTAMGEPESCTPDTCYVSVRTGGEMTCDDDGMITLPVSKQFVDGTCNVITQEECSNGEARVPCNANLLELPFFGFVNLIISILGIFGAYSLLRKR